MPAQYAVTYLPLHDATDLNDVNQVVGNALGHAYLWENGTSTDLGTLGGSYSHADGINDLGQVVGYAALPGDTSHHAFLITPHGGEWFRDSDLDGRNDLMIDLGTPYGSQNSEATDVNNAGQVAGAGFVWDAVNGMVDLGGSATAINEVGQVTGAAGWPFLWDAVNGMTLLDPGPGYFSGSGEGVNDAGIIAGYYWVDNGLDNPTQIGFGGSGWLYGRYGGHSTLSSSAADINNSGQVIGSITEDNGMYYETFAVLWDAGEVVVLRDHLLPGNEYATVEVARAINDRGAILAGPYNGWGEYLLTPVPAGAPLIRIADAPAVTEGNAGTVGATFTVTLSAAGTETITVAYATRNDTATASSDYQAASGTLTYAPGQTSKTITVLVNGDRVVEWDETFVVYLSSPTNAAIATGYGRGTVVDDEPRISIGDATVTEGNTGTVAAAFTLTLSSVSEVDVTVHYDTANMTAAAGSDFTGASGDVVIPAGRTSATFTVAVGGDRLFEPTETFAVNLSGATNAIIADGRGVGTIADDEPRIRISDVANKEGRKNTTLFTFTVTLSAAYDQVVTMSFRTVNGTATTTDSDYIARTGTLTFAPGETTKTIAVEVRGDTKREANETFYLDLFHNSVNSLLLDGRGIGTIVNDD